MKLGHYQRLVRMAAGALMLLLVQGLYLSSDAYAGCSHLVGAQSDPRLDLRLLDDVVVPGFSYSVPVDAYFPGEGPAPGRPSPCSGLSCSSPTPLQPSGASPEPIGSDQWGAVDKLVTLESQSAHAMAVDDTVVASRRRACSIFHPPPSSDRIVHFLAG
jgi:hypothetical protein